MFKTSLTVHKSLKGKLTVLVCSEDADEAIQAYKVCKEPGEVQLIQRGNLQKQKKIRSGIAGVSVQPDEPKKEAAPKTEGKAPKSRGRLGR